MLLTLWIFDPDPSVPPLLKRASRAIRGLRIEMHPFSSLPPDLSRELERLAPEQTPDLIVGDPARLDSLIPFLQNLRLQYSIDVLFLTTFATASLVTFTRQLGAVDLILKPCPLHRLEASLRLYLRLRRSLPTVHPLSQGQIDLFYPLYARQTPSALAGLTSSQLSAFTRLISFLSSQPGRAASALEAARFLGVSRSGARRQLERLVSAGYVTKEPVLTSRQGRPLILYRLS